MSRKDNAARKDYRQTMWVVILLVVGGLGSVLYGIKHYVRCDTELDPMSTTHDPCR